MKPQKAQNWNNIFPSDSLNFEDKIRADEKANVYGKVMCIIDDIRGVVRGDKRQVLEDLKDKLREKFEVKND